MTLLHCDGFDSKTSELTGTYASTQAVGGYQTGRFGSGFSWQSNSGLGQLWFRHNFISPQTTIYSGVAIVNRETWSSGEGVLFQLFDTSEVMNLRIRPSNSGTAGSIRAVKTTSWNSAGTGIGAASAAGVVPSGVWTFIEMKLVCGVTGSVIVRQNGLEILNVTGDTGSTQVTGIALTSYESGSGQGSWNASYDDWWVCNGSGTDNNNFLGDLRVLNLPVTGAGSVTQLTPSAGANWDCVEEIPPTTANWVGSATAGDKDLYDLAPLGAAYSVKGARVIAQAYASDAGTIKGRTLCKSGATTANGSDVSLTATPKIVTTMYETDPNTGALWSPASGNAAFNSTEFGWEVRA